MNDLDGLRRQGDAIFDPILADLAAKRELGALQRALLGYTRNADPVPTGLPEPLRGELAAAARLPAWVDHARLDRAAAFFGAHSVSISLLLGTTSLLECFAAGEGVKALYATRQMLRAGVTPRIGRTAGFVLHVMAPGGFSRAGAAIPALLKVRLQHASVRGHLLAACGWDPATRGAPICQEDQIGTLLAFAYSPLLKLRLLGARVPREVVEDVLHLWRVAGEVLGASPAWLPRTEPEARALAEETYRRQFAPTPEGIELAASLIDAYAARLPSPALRAPLLRTLRHLVGAEIYDALQLPDVPGRAWVAEDSLLRSLAQATLSSRVARAASSGLGVTALRFHAQRLAAA